MRRPDLAPPRRPSLWRRLLCRLGLHSGHVSYGCFRCSWCLYAEMRGPGPRP